MTKAERIEAMARGIDPEAWSDSPLWETQRICFALRRRESLDKAQAAYDAADVEGMVREAAEEAAARSEASFLRTSDIDAIVGRVCGNIEALDRACRMALEALVLVTDAGEDEAEKWSVSGGAYEGVKCVAAINAIRAAIPMPHEELADGWCVPAIVEGQP